MEEHVRQRSRQRAHARDQPRALDGVCPHVGKLRLVERTRPGQHVGPNVHLAEIVERGTEPKLIDSLALPPEPDRHDLGVGADTSGVPSSVGSQTLIAAENVSNCLTPSEVPLTRQNPFP
jgi:hypothetical protein